MEVEAARKLTNRIYMRLDARRPEIDRLERYYQGDQPLNFATEEWKKANAARYSGFSDNWCGTVVNAEAERLKPIGITNLPRRAASQLWDGLQASEFDMQFSQGAVTALTARRVFVIVWADADGEPSVSFEHPSLVEIEYDWENPRVRKAALKTWVDDELEYATLYTADHLFKWQRARYSEPNERASQAEQAQPGRGEDGGWVPREASGEGWMIPNPLGVVPVVEIGNRPTLMGDPLSEIQGVIPMQDAINLLWAYLFLAADYASMDARVLFGDPPTIPILDETGKIIGTRPVDMKDLREKRILTISGDNASIDSWKAAQLDIFTDTIEIAVSHIAAQTRTPQHYLVSSSERPAAALEAQEIGLTKKAREFMTFTDPQLREVIRLMALVRGDDKLAASTRLAQFVWANPEVRSEAQMADALLKKRQIGYPLEYIFEMDGRSPTEIRRLMMMKQAEDAALLTAAVQGVEDEPAE